MFYLCTIQYNGSNVFIKYYSSLKSNAVCKNFICMNFAEILHLIYRKKRNSVQSTQDSISFSFKELYFSYCNNLKNAWFSVLPEQLLGERGLDLPPVVLDNMIIPENHM